MGDSPTCTARTAPSGTGSLRHRCMPMSLNSTSRRAHHKSGNSNRNTNIYSSSSNSSSKCNISSRSNNNSSYSNSNSFSNNNSSKCFNSTNTNSSFNSNNSSIYSISSTHLNHKISCCTTSKSFRCSNSSSSLSTGSSSMATTGSTANTRWLWQLRWDRCSKWRSWRIPMVVTIRGSRVPSSSENQSQLMSTLAG